MIRRIEPGGLESWRLAARMVIFIDFHGIEGSVVLGLMTGSAGTAVDVLVTCFSKKGGGSGRRGATNLPPSVIWVHYTDTSENQIFLVSYFLQMSLKHNACHNFRASPTTSVGVHLGTPF